MIVNCESEKGCDDGKVRERRDRKNVSSLTIYGTEH